MRYAEIFRGHVVHIGDAPVLPVFSGSRIAVDITHRTPDPEEGWSYDATTDAFSSDTAPVERRSRIVSRFEFVERLTDDELESVLDLARTNKKVAAFVKRIELAGEVDLDHPRVSAGLAALEAAEILTPGRAEAIIS